ncbi:sensor histidine kinase [Fibrella aquatilis]|uniref:Histidine kinase n=1 Tax=Fibrella aquatilis TaxID=2817059 RepID=A0A939JYN2_9BACT|nr:histidine kinase [Fibrella aquatilis]MBO0930041.1 histidine kinase [Fibrella aquatilis]
MTVRSHLPQRLTLPEWLVHWLVWTLLTVKDVADMYGRPTYPVAKTAVATYWLLGVGYMLISVLAFYLSIWLVAKPLLTGPLGWRSFGKAGLGLLVTLAAITVFRYGLEFYLFKPILGFDNYHRNTSFTLGWFVQNSVGFYFDYIIYGLLYAFFRRNFINERRRREAEQAQTAAELAFLRAQLNPHFLFNTINDIYALVYQKSDAAPGALLKLSELLRYVLHEARHDRVLLAKEIDYVNGLVDLQRIGSKDNLYVDYQLHGYLNGQIIAPMLLVSFVENAFKHGIVDNPNQPIQLRVDLTDTTLDFSLHNAKNHQQKDHTGGIGLANVQRRLDLLYPRRHTLQVTDGPNEYYVKLHLDL